MNKFYSNLRGLIAMLFSFSLILINEAIAQTETNTLADGVYYMKARGSEEYATRDPLAGGQSYEANWIYSKPVNADRNLQRFEFKKRENGRYTIRVLNPGVNDGYLVDYWESFWNPGYDLNWHTFNVYKDVNSGSYAIQTDGSASKIFIALGPWDSRKRFSNEGLTGAINPVSFPFELIPYDATKADANLVLNALAVKTVGDPNFTPTVSSSSSATVTYSSSNTNVAVIENGQVKIVGAGSAMITASQPANATHNADVSSKSLKVLATSNTLMTHLKFDNNVNDVFSNNATVIGTAPLYGDGKNQKAIILDGSQFVALQPGAANYDNITIASAIKISQTANWARVFDFGSDKGNYMFLTINSENSGKIRFAIKKNRETEQTITTTSSNLLSIGQWAHIALTFSSAGVAKLYVNGVPAATEQSVTPFTIKASDLGITTQNMIGKSQWDDPYLKASIDEFKIFNYVLSSSEIQSLASTTLPVKLSYYNAKAANDGKVALNWGTSSESNNDHFEIERSIDSQNFVKVASVASKSSNGNEYFVSDNSPAIGDNYYRLTQVDKDGTREILGVRSVSVQLKKESQLVVYPNPVEGNQVSIQLPQSYAGKEVTVKILNLSGQKLSESKVKLDPFGKIATDVKLTNGTYVLQVDNVASTKLIVK